MIPSNILYLIIDLNCIIFKIHQTSFNKLPNLIEWKSSNYYFLLHVLSLLQHVLYFTSYLQKKELSYKA